ncbi:MAG: phosphoribosylformylglycinamidine synthase subunit PurL, partial [Chitinophagaceae bacterium]|nr:phosphoribosylformylglycinamidine synthase subunit PurL [Chitinophagaceae bacterium]
VYYQFVKAVTGMGDACRKFNTPVTGGNVSFYNQNPDGPVYPTPTIGMVGIVDDVHAKMTLDFKNEGDLIILIGTQQNDIASSEYLHKLKKVEFSPAPHFDLDEEYTVQQLIASLIKEKKINSAHDISEGGLAITLLESGFHCNLGFAVQANTAIRKDAFWFGEAQSRVVVSCGNHQLADIEAAAQKAGVAVTVLGKVTAGNIEVNGESWGSIEVWKNLYDTAIEKLIK